MKSKRILVTGGAGYIGSHTAVELIQSGYDVFIADNFYNSSPDVIRRIKDITGVDVSFEEIDCTDQKRMRQLFIANKIDAVIHFAAYKAVGESVQKPLMYYQNNVSSLVNVLSLAEEFGVQGFVFSSSCTVYGQPDILPVTEEAPLKPAESPYGRTKQVGESILEDFAKVSKGLKTISLRYFNPIGAHPSSKIGEKPQGVPNNLLPYLTQTVAGIRECLSVYGDDYSTPDGTAVRDYIDVVDLARAHVAAVDRLLLNPEIENLEYYNVGTGKGVSVLGMIKAFENANNLKVNYKVVGRREGDIEAIWAEPTLAQQKLGWTAKISIEETLRNAWEWEKAFNKSENESK